MDVFTTLSAMATAYGYYKATVYTVDTVDKGVRFYTFCKNAVGYIRTPFRYYQGHYYLDDRGGSVGYNSSNSSVIYNEHMLPKSASCNDIRLKRCSKKSQLTNSKSMINLPIPIEEPEQLLDFPQPESSECVPSEVGPVLSNDSRRQSVSVASTTSSRKSNRKRSKTEVFEDDSGTWILVKNKEH